MTVESDIPEQLLDGYRRFRGERFAAHRERFRALEAGQAPAVMVIACADSRVAPSTIFSAAPGELFVVRNVAALVPPAADGGRFHDTAAAIEFAVTGLSVKDIVVMGHAMCGGVSACLAAADAPAARPAGSYVGTWVEVLAPARQRVLETLPAADGAGRQLLLERLGVQHSIKNLLTYDFVAGAVDAGRLGLHGAWFSIAEGTLHWLDPATGDYEAVTA